MTVQTCGLSVKLLVELTTNRIPETFFTSFSVSIDEGKILLLTKLTQKIV